jgi:hypothetical protein
MVNYEIFRRKLLAVRMKKTTKYLSRVSWCPADFPTKRPLYPECKTRALSQTHLLGLPISFNINVFCVVTPYSLVSLSSLLSYI